MAEIKNDVPPPKRRGMVKDEFPFHKMKIGDSMRIDKSEGDFRRIISYAFMLTPQTGARFTTKWFGDHGIVWRIEK